MISDNLTRDQLQKTEKLNKGFQKRNNKIFYVVRVKLYFIINISYHAQCACSDDVADSVAAVQFTKLKW